MHAITIATHQRRKSGGHGPCPSVEFGVKTKEKVSALQLGNPHADLD